MSASISRDQVVRWLTECAQEMAEHRQYLTDLDAAIGDGDHGINMDRGFRAVMEQLPGLAQSDVGAILKGVAMALISSVGGAAGPLYGTFFLRAAAAAGPRRALEAGELESVLREGVQGVIERGKARPGDKTMVDTLLPAVEALSDSLADGEGLGEALRRCVRAAEEGARSTTPLQARKGRASYLGERSVGHLDPGAMSAFYMLRALEKAAAAG